jgi:hypothetical protein
MNCSRFGPPDVIKLCINYLMCVRVYIYIFLSPTPYRVLCYSGPIELPTLHIIEFTKYYLKVTKE